MNTTTTTTKKPARKAPTLAELEDLLAANRTALAEAQAAKREARDRIDVLKGEAVVLRAGIAALKEQA